MDKQSNNQRGNDFSGGSAMGNIIKLAVPVTLAQLINVLYNIVGRVYIGMIPKSATPSPTGLGLYLPIISIVIAFANLFGMGGAPLYFIERGRGNEKEMEAIIGNPFVMTVAVGILLTVLGLIFKRLMLYLFGASDTIIPCADAYVTVCLIGNTFIMTGLGTSSFTNSQDFGTVGMMTVLSGTVANIVLDPVFIFVFHMGVRSATLATILSQMLSTLWVLALLTGRRTVLKLRPSATKLNANRLLRIAGLGVSGFTMSITNSFVQIMYNSMLQKFGDDLYVGIMTVINLVRGVISMPANGLTNNVQSVLRYNYGARGYKRMQKTIVFMSVVYILYTVVAWRFVDWLPTFFIHIFNRERDVVEVKISAICMYFFGFFVMSLQFTGQSVFVGLGKSRNTIFFSTFRKIIIIIPLIIIPPTVFGMGTQGILMAEPISNSIGDATYFGTMLLTVQPELRRGGEENHN